MFAWEQHKYIYQQLPREWRKLSSVGDQNESLFEGPEFMGSSINGGEPTPHGENPNIA